MHDDDGTNARWKVRAENVHASWSWRRPVLRNGGECVRDAGNSYIYVHITTHEYFYT